VCCCRQEEWSDDLPNLLSLVGKLISNLAGDQYASHYQGGIILTVPQGFG